MNSLRIIDDRFFIRIIYVSDRIRDGVLREKPIRRLCRLGRRF
jgi:hypothetical protein